MDVYSSPVFSWQNNYKKSKVFCENSYSVPSEQWWDYGTNNFQIILFHPTCDCVLKIMGSSNGKISIVLTF